MTLWFARSHPATPWAAKAVAITALWLLAAVLLTLWAAKALGWRA